MTDEIKTDSKKCQKNRHVMIAYGFVQLGSSFVSALSLSLIALGFASVTKESKLFNNCVEDLREAGSRKSAAVRFCNGGK